ncbi:hypothetical protein Pcinc_039962, partial [Petrolisthes cinctipes]
REGQQLTEGVTPGRARHTRVSIGELFRVKARRSCKSRGGLGQETSGDTLGNYTIHVKSAVGEGGREEGRGRGGSVEGGGDGGGGGKEVLEEEEEDGGKVIRGRKEGRGKGGRKEEEVLEEEEMEGKR